MMRSIFLTLIVFLGSLGAVQAAATGTYAVLEQKDLNGFFSNIQVADGKLIFTRNDQDLGLHMQIGTAPKTDCLPSTMFEVPFGTACRLFNGQSSLKLIPPAPKAAQSMFLVEEVNRHGDVHVGILQVDASHDLKVLPVHVADKGALYKFEKDWVLGTGSYPPTH